MKAVITVVGKDMVGILATASTTCASANVNILDVTQTILDDYFTMIMLVDISQMDMEFGDFEKTLEENLPSMKTHIMHEDIFKAMHEV